MSKTKTEIAPEFAAFEARNKTTLKDVRKQEKMSFANPLPIGHSGVAVITSARAFGAGNEKIPTGLVEATVINDGMYDGKTFAAAIRQFKDTQRQTSAQAYGNFLDSLEDIGLSRSTRENAETLAEMFDELLAEPHYISFNVVKNDFSRDGKEVKCAACPPPEGMSGHVPVQETAADTPAEAEEDVSDLEEVLYLKKPHYKLGQNEDGTYNLKQKKGGKVRENIPEEDIEFPEED